MRVYLNPTGEWPNPFVTELNSVVVEASDEATLQEVAERAVSQTDTEFEPTWIWLVTKADDHGRQRMTNVPAVIDDEDILRWTSGELGDVTLHELRRTYEAGFFNGDPDAICAEHMLGSPLFPQQRRTIGTGLPTQDQRCSSEIG